MAEAVFVADKRIYLNADGEVVGESSADRVSLLVAKGGTLPYNVAVAHGLMQGDRDTQTEPNAGNVAEALAAVQAENESLKGQVASLKGAVGKPASKAVLEENERLKARVAELEAATSASAVQSDGGISDPKAVPGPNENKVITSGQVENK